MTRLLRNLLTCFLVTAAATIGCTDSITSVAPAAKDPELVALGAVATNRFVSAETATELVARLRIDARGLEREQRPPINLALVVDTSGSMEGAAIDDARSAAMALVDELSTGDRLAVVTFDSRARVLVESTVLNPSTSKDVRKRIGAMRAHGTTDMYGGLAAGLAEIARTGQPHGIQRLVLLSDGIPNDEANVGTLAQDAKQAGVSITALGLGLEYNETLLASLAQQSGGKFHYIEESANVAKVFRNEVLRLERVVAGNAELLLSPGPGITISEVIGQQASQFDHRRLSIALGDLGEGEQRDVFVRLDVGPHRERANVELLDGVLSFDDRVAGAGRLERRIFLAARATANPGNLAEGRDLGVERSAQQAHAAASTIEAIGLARSGQADQARAVLEQAEKGARKAAASHDDADLLRQANEIEGLLRDLPKVAPAMQAGGAGTAAMPSAPRKRLNRSHSEAIDRLQ